MLLQFCENGLHLRTSVLAPHLVPVPILCLTELLTNAYESSCPNPHLNIICTRSTLLRRVNRSPLSCQPSRLSNSRGCGIFSKQFSGSSLKSRYATRSERSTAASAPNERLQMVRVAGPLH